MKQLHEIKETPGIKQFKEVKSEYPDSIIFFRMGDFYEMFFEDAKTASKILGITLTKRGGAPLAGVPHYTGEENINKMVKAGYKVAVCEQLEDPKTVKNRIVKRGVIKVITPGTITALDFLDSKSNNYIVCIVPSNKAIKEKVYERNNKNSNNNNLNKNGEKEIKTLFGFSIADVSTGVFKTTVIDSQQMLEQELARFNPSEILIPQEFQDWLRNIDDSTYTNQIEEHLYSYHSTYKRLTRHFNVLNLEGFGIEDSELAIQSSGGLLSYLYENQKDHVKQITSLSVYNPSIYMILDRTTIRNLELFTNIRDNTQRGSLISVIDLTVTNMGGRLLKYWLSHPLLHVETIQERLNAVEELTLQTLIREEVKKLLDDIYDIERLITRISTRSANPKDLIALKNSLDQIPKIKKEIENLSSHLIENIKETRELRNLVNLIDRGISENPPSKITDGNIIKREYSKELDELRDLMKGGKKFIAELEAKEQESAKIPLKIGFNKIHGYYIEVTKRFSDKVPQHYIRRQTLTNAERYITPELKDKEEAILNAEEKIVKLEQELFNQILEEISNHVRDLQEIAQNISLLDVLISFATCAVNNNYIKPQIHDGYESLIDDGRHPVIEQVHPEPYVPNHTILTREQRLMIITGANMSGKCVTGDTMIFTDQGVLPIESFKPSKIGEEEFKKLKINVHGIKGKEKTSHFYYDGKKPTIKISTRFGYEMEGTKNHPILVRTKEGEEIWRKLGEIEKQDCVIINRNIDLWGKSTSISKGTIQKIKEYNYNNRVKEYKLPNKIDKSLAYVIGLLIGDGSLTNKGYIYFSNIDKQIIKDFKDIIKKKFNYCVKTRSNGKDHSISSRRIRLFFEKIGLDYVTSLNKEIPESILKAPKEIIREFIRGVVDTDGDVNKKYGNVCYSSSSYKLAKQVHIVLLNFGVISSLKPKKTNRNVNYRVHIYGEDAIHFHKLIGFKLKRKKIRNCLASKTRMPNYGIPHMKQILKKIQKRIVEKKDKKLTLKKAKNISDIFYIYIPKNNNISYKKLKELIDYCKLNKVKCKELEQTYENNYHYEPIAKVIKSRKKKEVYDFTVPKTHSFTANGLINHNSSFMRQVALIHLLAQIGSFVPCNSAKLALIDRIFTRVGAYDDLTMGQSTFMVEMTETANILNNLSKRSLVIMDEIGRGTSTFDGISLAWAIAECLYESGAKTLFATHYHQLNKLSEEFEGVKNYNLAMKEKGEDIIFLRKLIEGGTDKSYGIQVAKLAGVPSRVIDRARKIQNMLETEDEIGNRLRAPLKKKIEKPLLLEDIQIDTSKEIKNEDVSLNRFME